MDPVRKSLVVKVALILSLILAVSFLLFFLYLRYTNQSISNLVELFTNTQQPDEPVVRNLFGQIKEIKDSGQKSALWTLAYNKIETDVEVKEPMVAVYSGKGGAKQAVNFSEIKQGDWVYIEWSKNDSVKNVYVTDTFDFLRTLKPDGSFNNRNIAELALESKLGVSRDFIFLVTSSEDGSGRGTLLLGKTIDGQKLRLGCYTASAFEVCTGNVVGITNDYVVLYAPTDPANVSPDLGKEMRDFKMDYKTLSLYTDDFSQRDFVLSKAASIPLRNPNEFKQLVVEQDIITVLKNEQTGAVDKVIIQRVDK